MVLQVIILEMLYQFQIILLLLVHIMMMTRA
jgi:hypothetical protein